MSEREKEFTESDVLELLHGCYSMNRGDMFVELVKNRFRGEKPFPYLEAIQLRKNIYPKFCDLITDMMSRALLILDLKHRTYRVPKEKTDVRTADHSDRSGEFAGSAGTC